MIISSIHFFPSQIGILSHLLSHVASSDLTQNVKRISLEPDLSIRWLGGVYMVYEDSCRLLKHRQNNIRHSRGDIHLDDAKDSTCPIYYAQTGFYTSRVVHPIQIDTYIHQKHHSNNLNTGEG